MGVSLSGRARRKAVDHNSPVESAGGLGSIPSHTRQLKKVSDMTERKYSVNDLAALRRAVENKWAFGSYNLVGSRQGRSYQSGEKEKAVEELVRTHMLAGHIADDLYASEQSSNKSSVTE